jgi:hypothetical protein
MQTTATATREQQLLEEYEAAHLAYLEVSPRARAYARGDGPVDSAELEAIRSAKSRLLRAQDELYAFWGQAQP